MGDSKRWAFLLAAEENLSSAHVKVESWSTVTFTRDSPSPVPTFSHGGGKNNLFKKKKDDSHKFEVFLSCLHI